MKLYKIAVMLVHELLERRSDQLRFHESKTLMIMPLYFFKEFRKGLMQGEQNSVGIIDLYNNNLNYRGLKVLLGYENKVIIFHEGFVETNDPAFKVELDLSDVNHREIPEGYEFIEQPKELNP